MTHLTIYMCVCVCYFLPPNANNKDKNGTSIVFPMVNIKPRFTRNAQGRLQPGTPWDPGHLEEMELQDEEAGCEPEATRCAVCGGCRGIAGEGKAMEKAVGDGWKMWEKKWKMWKKTVGKCGKHVETCEKMLENVGKYWDFINIKVDFWRNISEWK